MFPIRDTIPSRHLPVVTWGLIGLNALIFVQQAALPPPELERLFYLFGMVPARLSDPGWALSVGLPPGGAFSFFSSMFLHGGFLHLLLNMWTLWIFGDNVEDRMGSLRFLAFYVICGLAAGATHFVSEPASTLPTVGASGAIAGVLGAYLVLFPHSRVIAVFPILFWPLFFELPAFFYLAFWFLTQLFQGTLASSLPESTGGVAWWAHIGGFVTGLLLHRLFLSRKRMRESRAGRHLVLPGEPRLRR